MSEVIEGKAWFSHTKTANVHFGEPGKYMVNLVVSEDVAQMAEERGVPVKTSKNTDERIIVLSKKAGGTRKDGTTFTMAAPPVVDNDTNPYPNEIPNGSLVRIQYVFVQKEGFGKIWPQYELQKVRVIEEAEDFGVDDNEDF